MSIEFTRNELERLVLLVGRAIMDANPPDIELETIMDKVLPALEQSSERIAAPIPLWDVGIGEDD